MSVFRLIYLSRAARVLSPTELAELTQAAAERNVRDGITGMLCCAAPYYLQVLEGPMAAVNRLLASLFRDPRHTDVTVTTAGTVAARLFPQWGMRLIDPSEAPNGEFDPRLLGHEGAAPELSPGALLAFLQRHAAVASLKSTGA